MQQSSRRIDLDSPTVAASRLAEPLAPGDVVVNGERFSSRDYYAQQRRRIEATLGTLRDIGARRLIEAGAHPWTMTAEFADDPSFEIAATISAEEVSNWTDDIGVTRRLCELTTARGTTVRFPNYSANIERTLFDVPEPADTVVACEIIEHLTRSPHVMLLNMNHWLPPGGRLFVTTPNGALFFNPFRVRTLTNAYRCNMYQRHSYLYTMADLCQLIELCGFRIVERGYWDLVDRRGPKRLYTALARTPLHYFQEKFRETLYVVAEKTRDVTELSTCPRVYDPRGPWEHIAPIRHER
jgi:Methyltransferase domain